MDRDKVKKVLSQYYMEYISLDEACDMILRLGEERVTYKPGCPLDPDKYLQRIEDEKQQSTKQPLKKSVIVEGFEESIDSLSEETKNRIDKCLQRKGFTPIDALSEEEQAWLLMLRMHTEE